MKPPQILHLAAAHTATDPRIVEREGRSLVEAGYRVGYVTQHPRDEDISGIRIYGVPVARTGKERLARTTPQVVRRAAEVAGPGTIFHVHEPELLPFVLARPGRRFVYDAHEDTPRQALQQHWIPRPLRRPAGWTYGAFEWVAGRRAEHVFAAVPRIAERYPAGKTSLLRNVPRVEVFDAAAARPYAERSMHVAYVGGLSRIRGVREMMAAVERLPEAQSASLHLAGPFFPASLEDEARRYPGADRTRFYGRLDRAEVVRLLADARVGLVTLYPEPNHLVSLPVKLFEYMASGVPVVASDFPAWTAIVEETGCGFTVDPLDVDAISRSVRWLLEHPEEAAAMGRRGREAVDQRYSWTVEARTLLDVYARLL